MAATEASPALQPTELAELAEPVPALVHEQPSEEGWAEGAAAAARRRSRPNWATSWCCR